MKSFLLILFSSLNLMAQFPNPLDFNTATNATNTGTISMNSNDLHWTVALTNSVGPYIPAVSCGNAYPPTWVNSPYPNANWISYPHSCSANPAEHSCLFPNNLDVFYKLMVSLPATNCGQSISTPSAYCLSFDFYADNSVYKISVNGNTSYLNPSVNPYYDMDYAIGGQKTVSLCNYWQVGTNIVIVHVKSGAGNGIFQTWEALLAQVNPTINPTIGSVLAVNPLVSNVTCFGAANGSATLSVSGGSAPFSYTWLPSGGNSISASGLSPGIYTVLVSSSNLCNATKTLSISQPTSALLLSSSQGSIQCNGGTTTLNINAAGGTLPYNGTGTYTTAAGAYVYTVTDANNCSAILSGTLTQPSILLALNSQGSILCNGGTTTINVIANGGIPPYTGTGTFTLSSGPYTYIITDAHNCFATVNGTLGQPPVLMGSSTQGSVHCSGGTTTVNVSANGGTPPYSGTGTFNQTIGLYTYTLTDINNCVALVNGTITQGEPLAISVSTSQIKCPGANHTFTAIGGQTYTWNPGNFSGAIVTLNPTSTTVYTLTGTTSPGCLSAITFTQVVSPCVGIEETEVSNLDVFIFPNPTNDIITVRCETGLLELTLLNSMGMLILDQQSIQSKETSLDLSGLSRGIYFLRIKTLQGEVLEKIIKD